MKDASKSVTSSLSRRKLVVNAAFFAGASGLLGASLAPRASAAQAKLPQKDAAYQTTPKGKQRCDNCVQWQPPAACKVVAGVIAPAGWCSLYAAK